MAADCSYWLCANPEIQFPSSDMVASCEGCFGCDVFPRSFLKPPLEAIPSGNSPLATSCQSEFSYSGGCPQSTDVRSCYDNSTPCSTRMSPRYFSSTYGSVGDLPVIDQMSEEPASLPEMFQMQHSVWLPDATPANNVYGALCQESALQSKRILSLPDATKSATKRRRHDLIESIIRPECSSSLILPPMDNNEGEADSISAPMSQQKPNATDFWHDMGNSGRFWETNFLQQKVAATSNTIDSLTFSYDSHESHWPAEKWPSTTTQLANDIFVTYQPNNPNPAPPEIAEKTFLSYVLTSSAPPSIQTDSMPPLGSANSSPHGMPAETVPLTHQKEQNPSFYSGAGCVTSPSQRLSDLIAVLGHQGADSQRQSQVEIEQKCVELQRQEHHYGPSYSRKPHDNLEETSERSMRLMTPNTGHMFDSRAEDFHLIGEEHVRSDHLDFQPIEAIIKQEQRELNYSPSSAYQDNAMILDPVMTDLQRFNSHDSSDGGGVYQMCISQPQRDFEPDITSSGFSSQQCVSQEEEYLLSRQTCSPEESAVYGNRRKLIRPSRISCYQLQQVMPTVIRQFETSAASRKGLCRQLAGQLYPNSPKPSPNFLLNTLLPVFRAANALGFHWSFHLTSSLSFLRLWVCNQRGGKELIQRFRVQYNAPTGKEYRADYNPQLLLQ